MLKILIYLLIIALAAVYLSSGKSKSELSPSLSYPESDNQNTEESGEVTSDNWVCTDDCSGHEAGYDWANENGITDPDDCGGNSDSFIEGCQAYANEYNDENNYNSDNYSDY